MDQVGRDRLLALLRDALAEADRLDDTLLGALIAECIDAALRSEAVAEPNA